MSIKPETTFTADANDSTVTSAWINEVDDNREPLEWEVRLTPEEMNDHYAKLAEAVLKSGCLDRGFSFRKSDGK